MLSKRLTITLLVSALVHLAIFTAWWHGQQVITMSTTPIGSPLQIAINQSPAPKQTQQKPTSKSGGNKEIKRATASQNKVAAVKEKNQPSQKQIDQEQADNQAVEDSGKQTRQDNALKLARLNNNMVEYLSSEFKLRFKYPMLARKRGWQGEVLLGLAINRHGEIAHVAVQRSSGHQVLDSNAVKTFELIGAVSPILRTELMNEHQLSIPVVYKLTGG